MREEIERVDSSSAIKFSLLLLVVVFESVRVAIMDGDYNCMVVIPALRLLSLPDLQATFLHQL